MFRLVKDPVAPWPVKIPVVTATGDVVEEACTLMLARIGQRDFEHLFGRAPGDTVEEVVASNRRAFDRVVRGWEGIVDETGDPVPFTPEAVARLLDFPGFPGAFGAAYTAFYLALPEAREKNSARSPAGGQAAAETTAEAPATGQR